MTQKKYRISISVLYHESRGYSGCSPVDFDSYEEFINYLRANKINNFCLKYFSIIDDMPDFHKMGLSINDFTKEDFDWLAIRIQGNHKFLEYLKVDK